MMLFAVIAKSDGDSLQDLNALGGSPDPNQSKADCSKTSISVYTSENHGTTIEVPLTPESTVADILDCVTDPVRGSGYLVAITQDTEYILQAADNAFSFFHESWATSGGSPLTFVLRYLDPERPWPPPDLEARRQQMRRPHSSSTQSQAHTVSLDYNAQYTSKHKPNLQPAEGLSPILPPTTTSLTTTVPKLPGGPGDLTLAELQEMATRQQQQMEAQQQVLVAKEQRLKYLKQQEARHAQLASESERLRKIRERVESQELKLKKLRALRGQAEQHRSNNGQLNSELDAVRAVFNEKEKELAMAVARVDQLTRQLTDLRNGKTNTGLSGQKHAAAALELEKLRKELLLRNKLNEQQTNNITAKEKLMQQKREEMKNMDNRILELQQRLKKKKQQEDPNRQAYKQAANSNKQNNKENANNINNQVNSANTIKSGDPYIQYAPNDVVKDDSYSQHGHFAKQDPKYQTLPAGVRLGQTNADVKGPKPNPQQYENMEGQGDYNLPIVLPLGHGNNNNNQNRPGYNHNITSQQQQHRRPPPPNQQQTEFINPPHSKPQTFNNNDFSKPNQNYTNLPPTSHQQQQQQKQQQQHPQHPVPLQRQPHKNVIDQPTTTTTTTNYNSNISHPSTQTNRIQPSPNTPRGSSSTSSGLRNQDTGQGKGVEGLPPSSLHPVISIHEEERQAGSGQSSPASSEGSSNSSGGIQIKQDESNINETPIGPVSAMIERLNSNKGNKNQSTLQSKDGAKSSDSSPSAYAPPHFQTLSSSSSSNTHGTKQAFEGVTTFLAKPNLPSGHQLEDVNSPRTGLGLDSKPSSNQHPNTNNQTSTATTQSPPPVPQQPQPGQHPQLNLKPAPTYRYASKNQIANTYMGRLGGAAMEKYQQNLNKLYKNMEAQDSKTGTGNVVDSNSTQQMAGAITPGQEGEGQQTFGAVSPHDYPDIASDKGSYKLNTPKQVRRRHSDGESDDVNKALQDRQEQEAKEQQQQQTDEASKALKDQEKTINDKPAVSEKEKNQKESSIPKGTESLSSTASSVTSTTTTVTTTTTSSSSSTPVESVPKSSSDSKDSTNSKPSKVEAIVRKTKSNLKKNKGTRRCNNRVSFDPLALLLDGSLEGELDLVKKVAVQVDDVSTPNDEGITALHNAICAGHYEIVKFLIEFGCDVNSPDSDGWTPLHCAASCNNLPMVRFLVEHGACVFATTISDQETAADKCEEDEDGYDGCSDYLYSIQEKLGITNGGDVYAVFDYTASNSDELNFVINDKITVLRKGDETEKEWWWAQLNGKDGYIPRNLLGLYPRVLQQPSEVSEC